MSGIFIVGGGPAGISAALYALRAGVEVTVADSGTSALKKAHLIQNFYGCGTIEGEMLYENAQQQARQLGAQFVYTQVTGIQYDGAVFTVSLAQGESMGAQAVIIATGASRIAPAVAGAVEFEGRGISYCAVCDGFFYRDKTVAVLGSGEFARHEAEYLSQLAQNVHILTNGAPVQADFSPFTVHTEKLTEVFGGDTVQGVRFEGDKQLALDGVFIALGTAGSADFARTLGVPVENGKIVTDDNGETALAGLYAAGDCTKGILQIYRAVAEGSAAGTAAAAFVKGKNDKK